MHVVGALEHDGVPEIGGVAGVLEHMVEDQTLPSRSCAWR